MIKLCDKDLCASKARFKLVLLQSLRGYQLSPQWIVTWLASTTCTARLDLCSISVGFISLPTEVSSSESYSTWCSGDDYSLTWLSSLSGDCGFCRGFQATYSPTLVLFPNSATMHVPIKPFLLCCHIASTVTSFGQRWYYELTAHNCGKRQHQLLR